MRWTALANVLSWNACTLNVRSICQAGFGLSLAYDYIFESFNKYIQYWFGLSIKKQGQTDNRSALMASKEKTR